MYGDPASTKKDKNDDNTEVKTTVRLPRGSLKELKKTAIDENTTISGLIIKLLHDHVAAKKNPKK